MHRSEMGRRACSWRTCRIATEAQLLLRKQSHRVRASDQHRRSIRRALEELLAPQHRTRCSCGSTRSWTPATTISRSNHNGIRLSAKYPETAGTIPPADGTGFFLFLCRTTIEQQTGEVTPGIPTSYAYWPKQRSQYGDHWYPDGTVSLRTPSETKANGWLTPAQYPDFKPMPDVHPGTWTAGTATR